MTIRLEDMHAMSARDLYAIVERGAPLDLDAIADTTYTGIDLSMPAWFHKLAWKSFRKTFHRDPKSGALRGWNVKVQQTGWESPPAPKLDGKGRPLTFGHYELRPAAGLKFPRGWKGGHYLDYAVAGNRFMDVAKFGYCPIVAVNEGSSDLLLGWEVFKVGALFIPLSDFWVLRREGAIAPEDIVPRPDGRDGGAGRG
jgi:hypothetical protein